MFQYWPDIKADITSMSYKQVEEGFIESEVKNVLIEDKLSRPVICVFMCVRICMSSAMEMGSVFIISD